MNMNPNGKSRFKPIVCAVFFAIGATWVLAQAPATPPPVAGVPAHPALMPPRTFNSQLPLVVWVRTDVGDPGRKNAGRTPASQPINLPACLGWGVEPQAGVSLDAMVQEMQAQSNPGAGA